MATDYVAFAAKLLRSSPWRGKYGRRFAGSFALLCNSAMDGAVQALKAAWQRNPDGIPQDALGPLGEDLLLERYPVETDAQYLARLDLAWTTWQDAGGPQVLIDQLTAAGFPGVQIKTPLDWPTEPPVGYSTQFWVFFPEGTHTVTGVAPLVGGFVVGDGTIIGLSGISFERILLLRRIISKFKPGTWICRSILFEITPGTNATLGP
jgi:hypothetical protein